MLEVTHQTPVATRAMDKIMTDHATQRLRDRELAKWRGISAVLIYSRLLRSWGVRGLEAGVG
ncbi:hypothetical protein AS189_03755 [Arthrobacter alpinus]|uniref:Uncharacterized protein n=1 Tax=Arthrobacter alpinus TaxID=656366 RepID=A0A0S2LW92_9MICC|nr:hypothetical protein AS189_03755 [Arthrobacter alpinus]